MYSFNLLEGLVRLSQTAERIYNNYSVIEFGLPIYLAVVCIPQRRHLKKNLFQLEEKKYISALFQQFGQTIAKGITKF